MVDVANTSGLRKVLDTPIADGKTIFGITETGNKKFTTGYTCEANGDRTENCDQATWLHLVFNRDATLEQ